MIPSIHTRDQSLVEVSSMRRCAPGLSTRAALPGVEGFAGPGLAGAAGARPSPRARAAITTAAVRPVLRGELVRAPIGADLSGPGQRARARPRAVADRSPPSAQIGRQPYRESVCPYV